MKKAEKIKRAELKRIFDYCRMNFQLESIHKLEVQMVHDVIGYELNGKITEMPGVILKIYRHGKEIANCYGTDETDAFNTLIERMISFYDNYKVIQPARALKKYHYEIVPR